MITKVKILLVDDEPVFREGLRLKMLEEGYDISIAENGEQALQILGRKEFDIIISDIVMPFVSGLDLIQHIRNRGINLPVLILSAMEGSYFADKAMDLGASAFMAKPFKYSELRSKIRELLAVSI